jgi:hypothetical protein
LRRPTDHRSLGHAARALRLSTPLNRSAEAWSAKERITVDIITHYGTLCYRRCDRSSAVNRPRRRHGAARGGSEPGPDTGTGQNGRFSRRCWPCSRGRWCTPRAADGSSRWRPVGPAWGRADNPHGLRGRAMRLAPCARLAIMARAHRPTSRAADTTAVDPASSTTWRGSLTCHPNAPCAIKGRSPDTPVMRQRRDIHRRGSRRPCITARTLTASGSTT